MTYAELCAQLESLAEPELEEFQKKVISDTHYPMLCIRVPAIRKVAKAAAKGDWMALLAAAYWSGYEEVLALGLTVAYAKVPFAEKRTALRQVLPHLDSWAHTDSIVATLKMEEADKQAAWDFAGECLESDREYTVRFGVVLLMNEFLGPEWVERTLELLSGIRDDRYYVQMAVAWCLAEIAVTDFEAVKKLLQGGKLPLFTHNKTIQKMRESYRIAPQQKEIVKYFKRKEAKNEENHGN